MPVCRSAVQVLRIADAAASFVSPAHADAVGAGVAGAAIMMFVGEDEIGLLLLSMLAVEEMMSAAG